MNARELVTALRELGPQDKNVEYAYLARHAYDFRLNAGGPIQNLEEFKLFLHELSEAWRFADFPEGTHFPEPPMPKCEWAICIRCGHAHVRKCYFRIGMGKVCGCAVEVTA